MKMWINKTMHFLSYKRIIAYLATWGASSVAAKLHEHWGMSSMGHAPSVGQKGFIVYLVCGSFLLCRPSALRLIEARIPTACP